VAGGAWARAVTGAAAKQAAIPAHAIPAHAIPVEARRRERAGAERRPMEDPRVYFAPSWLDHIPASYQPSTAPGGDQARIAASAARTKCLAG
jgi:hypothetical protein